MNPDFGVMNTQRGEGQQGLFVFCKGILEYF